MEAQGAAQGRTDRVRARERDNLSIIEAHAVEDIAQVGLRVLGARERVGASGVVERASGTREIALRRAFLWAGDIPLSRRSEYRVSRSYGGVYSLAVSMHEFEPFIDHGHVESMRFFFGVQCTDSDVSFRAFAHLEQM